MNGSADRGRHATRRVLVVGGAGHVGTRLATVLAARGWQVTVAGRTEPKIRHVAERLGVSATLVDVDDADGLRRVVDADTVVCCCVDAATTVLVDLVTECGATLVDISADAEIIQRTLERSGAASASGARVVVGAGLQPGISGVLARVGVAQQGPGVGLRLALVVSAGDEFGPAAVDWMLANGAAERVLRAERLNLGPSFGARRALRFPFPDEAALAQLPGVDSVRTHLVVEPSAVGCLTAAVGRAGLLRLAARPWLRSRLLAALPSVVGRVGSNRVASIVVADGPSRSWRGSVSGHGESSLTAAGIVAVLDQVDELPSGAHWTHDIVDAERFLASLANLDVDLDIETGDAHAGHGPTPAGHRFDRRSARRADRRPRDGEQGLAEPVPLRPGRRRRHR